MIHKVEVQSTPKGYQVWWRDIDIFMSCEREDLEDSIIRMIDYIENPPEGMSAQIDMRFV